MIRSMEGFIFASVLDLNMGYYHIKLVHGTDSEKQCTIVFLWYKGKYKYKCLPMGIKIAWFPDVFQKVMSELVQDMEYAKTYLDDLLILTTTNISFKDHLLKLEMRNSTSKTPNFWYESECILSPNLSPLYFKENSWDTVSPDKVFNLFVTRLRYVLSLTLRHPKQEKKTKLCQFISIVNYYRDMWFCRSEILARIH
jgi:hypothetical protein